MAKIRSKEDALKQRLGADAKFPINGDFNHVSGVDVLIQDVEQLLLTVPGERVNRPDFGCSLMGLVWENQLDAEPAGIEAIKTAISKYEPRITLISVDTSSNLNTGLIIFNITFLVNETDEKLSLVFPFRSGTDLSFA